MSDAAGATSLFFSLIFLLIGLLSKRPNYKKDYFPSVSVLSWFWKDGNIVERKIKNFLSQDYPGKFEVIIVDNASKDETQKICKKYVRKGLIKYYRSKKEYDRKAYALDEAIKKVAKYDILAMTDPDGVCKKDWLKNIVQPFKDKSVGAAIGLTHAGNFYKNLFTKLRAVEDEWYYVISPLGRESIGNSVQLVCGANYAVRRDALENVGYHGKRTLGEDIELTIKLHAAGWKVAVTNAEVWQEEVENLKEYIRQRLRWTNMGIRCFFIYIRELVKIFKKKPVGLTLFALPIQTFSLVYMIMMVFGALFSLKILIYGISSFVIINLAMIIGMLKLKRTHLIPFVPVFLLLEPIYATYLYLVLFWERVIKKRKIVWRSLHDGYYHAGSPMILK